MTNMGDQTVAMMAIELQVFRHWHETSPEGDSAGAEAGRVQGALDAIGLHTLAITRVTCGLTARGASSSRPRPHTCLTASHSSCSLLHSRVRRHPSCARPTCVSALSD
jgi:hypothetical protein